MVGRGRLLVLALCALALGLAGLGAHAAAALAAGEPEQLQVDSSSPGRAIPSGFLGLATEYPAVPKYSGGVQQPLDPVFVQLIRTLIPGQSPVLRIGGDSTDWTWWPVKGTRKPSGIRFTLTPQWISSVRRLARATHAHLILGINLEAGRTSLASAEARALIAGLGRGNVAALEIGNEPELYATLPWYKARDGVGVPGRPPSFGPAEWESEFESFRRALPALPLDGPATGNGWWLANTAQFLTAQPRVRELTYHRYALNRCTHDRSSPSYPTVPNLVALGASRNLLQYTGPLIDAIHSHGLRFRVDELSSVTCGGRWHVSDTFASALWALDATFTLASADVDAVNVQTSPFAGKPNELFSFTYARGQWLGSVRPEYYGLLMFSQATPPGARLLPITTTGSDQVRSWATLGRDGRVRVVLINDSFHNAGSVQLTVPHSASRGTLEWLRAASMYSSTGVTIGGQSFDPYTATGRLAGPRLTETPRATGGRFTIRLPAASAALLTIPG
jgi:hypothetical protein